MQARHQNERERLKQPRPVADQEKDVDDERPQERHGDVTRGREGEEERKLMGREGPEKGEVVGKNPVVGIEALDLPQAQQEVADEQRPQVNAQEGKAPKVR